MSGEMGRLFDSGKPCLRADNFMRSILMADIEKSVDLIFVYENFSSNSLSMAFIEGLWFYCRNFYEFFFLLHCIPYYSYSNNSFFI